MPVPFLGPAHPGDVIEAALQAFDDRLEVVRFSDFAETCAEAARLIAEFHARGGQVTHCPPAEEPPPDQPSTDRVRR